MAHNASNEATYAVVSPLGLRENTQQGERRHLDDLNDRTIVELDGRAFRANETLAVIRELLKARYPRVKFVEAGTVFSPSSQDQAAGLREKSLAALHADLARHGADAVITGNGA